MSTSPPVAPYYSIEHVLEEIAYSIQEKLEKRMLGKPIKVIILSGPTGVGKTSLSLELARLLPGEIISADSMQIYRGMDIGTAKVSKEVQDEIPHHLVDVRDIWEPYNVRNFFDEAIQSIIEIASRNHAPIVVGGTGFYIHSLLFGPPQGPPSDPGIRAMLEREEEKFGAEFLYEKLNSFDPEYAKTITPHDRHKIVRALEIIEISGKKVSAFAWKQRKHLPGFDFHCWFLHRPRDQLYERLSRRCDEMIRDGLLQEVLELDRIGIRSNSTASASVGYRQTLDFLDSSRTPEDYENYVEQFKMASRHLAKRQFTWFRKEPDFRWIDLSELPEMEIVQMIADDYLS